MSSYRLCMPDGSKDLGRSVVYQILRRCYRGLRLAVLTDLTWKSCDSPYMASNSCTTTLRCCLLVARCRALLPLVSTTTIPISDLSSSAITLSKPPAASRNGAIERLRFEVQRGYWSSWRTTSRRPLDAAKCSGESSSCAALNTVLLKGLLSLIRRFLYFHLRNHFHNQSRFHH